ncbi:hypothetical protein E3E12_01230 [Formicincola oecophyllae]|uniref:Alginate export domain-containing protein n=1 Tax=Formicincola oecophyllae TaxID=2558361 RepID=A0A4Y6U6Q3_9PROT|nr:alginate export family protein [Formicincola oecophyllae]QDH13043.1 hypothetical protein E3E12_01230 [Formicincola oecophyllae]
MGRTLNHINITSGGAIWIGFHGESRVRNWFNSRPMLNAFGGGGHDPDGFWVPGKGGAPGHYTSPGQGPVAKSHNDAGRFYVRNLLSADLHLGQHVRVFGQLINADAGGWRPYFYSPIWNKDLDVQQAFVELAGRAPDWIGGHGGFIFGRQQFSDGPEYLIGTREVPTVPQSWNGFRLYHFWRQVRVDAWDFVATNDMHKGNSFFKDTEMYNNRLYGFNTTIALPSRKGLGFLELFYLGFTMNGGGLDGNSSAATWMNPRLGSQRIPGSTARNDFGFRWHGTYGGLLYSVGGIYQTGTFHETHKSPAQLNGMMGYGPGGWNRRGFDNGYVSAVAGRRRAVEAFSVNTTLAWRFTGKMASTLGVQADIYSGGGGNRRQGTINTYIAPNISLGPNPMYLDPTASLNGANLIGVQPFYRFNAIPGRLSFKIAGSVFWRYSTHDGLYAYLMSGLHTLRPWHGHYMGFVPRVEATATLCPNVTWNGFLARWMTGHQLSRHGGASSTTAAQSNFFFHF